jgi:hypothetical protein
VTRRLHWRARRYLLRADQAPRFKVVLTREQLLQHELACPAARACHQHLLPGSATQTCSHRLRSRTGEAHICRGTRGPRTVCLSAATTMRALRPAELASLPLRCLLAPENGREWPCCRTRTSTPKCAWPAQSSYIQVAAVVKCWQHKCSRAPIGTPCLQTFHAK